MLRDAGSVPVEQRHAPFQGPGGEVLGQLGPHAGVDDHAGGGEQLFHLAADVGGVPRRPGGRQPGQHALDRPVPVQPAHGRRGQVDFLPGVAVAQGRQLGYPAGGQIGARLWGDLVRAALGPRPGTPRPPQVMIERYRQIFVIWAVSLVAYGDDRARPRSPHLLMMT